MVLCFPDGQVMLIDAGVPDAGGSIVKRLKELGISRLDYVVYSHDPDFLPIPSPSHCLSTRPLSLVAISNPSCSGTA